MCARTGNWAFSNTSTLSNASGPALNVSIIIDFDSTFITVESLDELAKISLESHPQRKEILRKITCLTEEGMNGAISFGESLSQRMKLLKANRSHVKQLSHILKDKVTPSVSANRAFFQRHAEKIHIISGGFREVIRSVTEDFHIWGSHIHANKLQYDSRGRVTGVDRENPLSRDGGKEMLIRSLLLLGEIIVLGDGYNDYRIRAAGQAHKFVAFTENISRAAVIRHADGVANTFDEFIEFLKAWYPSFESAHRGSS